MSNCKRKIILIFGYIFIMVILFAPFELKKWIVFPQNGKLVGRQVYEKGFIFLPMYFVNAIKYKKAMLSTDKLSWDKRQTLARSGGIIEGYKINSDLFITEITLIISLWIFAYIIFCLALGKGKKKNEAN